MKCPKCGYLGFEHVERCRNCGYDFLLSRSVGVPDLQLKPAGVSTDPSPLADIELVEGSRRPDTQTFVTELDRDLDRALHSSEPLSMQLLEAVEPQAAVAPPAALRPITTAAPPRPAAPASGSRLPLFSPGAADDDAPLISRPSAPRQPLAVRRATPEQVRLRTEGPRATSLELPLDGGHSEPPRTRPAPAAAADTSRLAAVAHEGDAAGLNARLAAAAIDLLILAAIDAAVIYFTLQICAVSLNELAILPKAPLVAFLLVQNGGYLVAFTAGGQTLGKMAAGIKVVSAEGSTHLAVGRALLRTLLWLVLAVPAGLGFVSAAFSRDHRGLHDRCAGTRVVRASA